MPTVLLLLIVLIGLAPVGLVLDGPLALGIGCGQLAAAMIVVANRIKPGEAAHLRAALRPVAVAAMLPTIVMVFQVVPLPISFRLSNPIWQSAAATLGQPLLGSITIDTGSTVLSLCRYLAWLAVGFLACTVSIDRQRAEWVLLATTCMASLVAVLLIFNGAGLLPWLSYSNDAFAHGGALDAAALGIILSTVCLVRVYERFETRQFGDGRSVQQFAIGVAIFAAGFAICATAIAFSDSGNILFAAGAGLATFIGVVVVRRLGLGPWIGLALAVAACLAAGKIVIEKTNETSSGILVRFAEASPSSRALAERMIADSTWTGSGAATYRSLAPIYQERDDLASDLGPPGAAAEMAVEWGRPMLVAAGVAAITLIVMLLRAGLRRGRDSFYPSAGAGVCVALLISAFGNDGLLGSTVQILAGCVLGLALAQSRGRVV